MEKLFLVGVSDIFAYNKNTSELLFQSKTMLDTGIEVSTDSTNINGGQGNSLQYIYFHTPELSITLTETQFNLAMIASNVGSTIVTGDDVWGEETITLGVGGAGTVTGTPLVTPDADTTVYGWVTDSNGDTTRVVFTGSDFTLAGGSENDVVCVRYYQNDSAARSVTINANFIPANVRLVMDCQLASSTTSDITGASIIGRVQFEIDSAQLSGSQSIEMSSSGVSQTPLSAMALASTSNAEGCVGAGIYGTIREIINNANWYDNVIALAAVPSEVAITGTGTEQLTVYAIPQSGSSFIPPVADLTFDSDTPGVATVSATGLITGVSAGTAEVSVEITAKPSVLDNVEVTVS